MSRFRLHCFSVLEFPHEKLVGPMDSGDPVLERSRSAVCPARYFISALASTTAWVADVLVGLGPDHSRHLLDRRTASDAGATARIAHPGTSAGERGSNTSLHMPVGRNTCRSGPQSLEFPEDQGPSCQRLQRRHPVEMAGVLGHLRRAADVPVLRTLSRQ